MHLFHSHVRGTTAGALSVAVLSVLATLTGCASNDQSSMNTSPAETSSPAVQASEVTHVDADKQSNHFGLAFPTGDRNTSTLLVEDMGPKQVKVGHEATSQIKVTNLTNAPVRGITLWSRQNDGFQVKNVTGATQRPAHEGQIGFDVGNLGPKESRTITVTGVPARVGTIDTCYSITYQPPTLCTAMAVVNPALRVAIEGPSNADICQPIDYHYSVTNTGTGTARNVVLRDELPDGLTTSDGQHTISANLGDIPQGQNREVIAHLKAQRTGHFATRAEARSQDDMARSGEVATAVHAPTLDLALRGPDQDYVGKQIRYEATITNKGDAPARNAMLKVHGSDAGRILAINTENNGSGGSEARLAGEHVNANSGTNLGTLNPGESRTVSILAEGAGQGGTLTLEADAAAQCAAQVNRAVQTRIMTIPSLLLETVDETDPVRIGENVTYDVKVTNQGTGPDTNVRVTATIPEGEQFISAKGASEGTVSGNTITFAPIPMLAPKASVTWKVTVKATHPGDVQFRTTATSNEVKAPAEKAEPTKLY